MADVKVQATVDRIEGDMAILLLSGDEGETPINWPLALLPPSVHEGSKLDINIKEDPGQEAEARQRVTDLLNKLTGRTD